MASGSILMHSPGNPTTSLPIVNGHGSPLAHNVTNVDDEDAPSESELSDPTNRAAAALSPSSDAQSPVQDEDNEVDALSDSSHSEDAEGSEDGDYESETPPAQSDNEEVDRSSSEDSQRPRKRKASVEDDEYINQNPELYGLRRSGRARANRRVIDSSSEEDDSDSDAVNPRRKKRRTIAPARGSRRPSPDPPSLSESDSDSDAYVGGRRQVPTKKQRKHRHLVASGRAPPSQAEVRFSTRNAAKVTSYNEDDDDNIFSDESEDMTPNYWVAAEEDDSPQIDRVILHRRREDSDGEMSNLTKHDYEYLIKWVGKAPFHATYEEFSSLSGYKGFRKVENYFRKIVLEEIMIMGDPEVPSEEKEKWNLDREKVEDLHEDSRHVERVIASQEGEEETEYLVKWKALPYEECTWEPASLVGQLAQDQIDRYLDRSSKVPVSDKRESNIATRRKYVAIREQPEYIKFGQLRDFQLRGVSFLAYHWCKGDNAILADEMGLGKTVQTVSFMNWLRHDRGQQGPFVVVVPLSTLPAWAETFDNWAPDMNYVVYNGNEASRKIIREYEMLVEGNPKRTKFHVLLTTYEFVLADSTFLSQIKWQFMAVDEAHRLKNRESQLYAKLMDFGAPSRLLITGTPMQNTLGELSALMDFIMPGMIEVDENIDLQSESASQKIAELTNAISPYMIRRTKQKVENDLPPKTEKIIRVELSDLQLEYYKNILTRNYAALNQGGKGPKQSLLNIMMELKKASNHPYMFAGAEERMLAGNYRREDQLKALVTSSGKMMLLDRLLTKLKKDNHRVLIFSQMVKMLDILGDYLQLRGYQFQRLDGTITSGQRRQAIDHFNASESQDFCFLLSTRAGGLGINLMTADTVILFDSDWNPQADLQAMARAHRIGQKNPVTVYRLVSKDTVEEEVLERARNKLMLEYITIQRAVTDKGDKEAFDRAARAVAEPTSSDDINRILKKRGQKMFEQTGNQKKLEELDIDAVLENAEEHKTEQPEGITTDGGEEFLKSFEYTDVKLDLEWDDIIPKDQLEEIKAEEKRKQDEEFLAREIEQSQPRKRKAPNEEREQRAAKKRARQAAQEAAEAAQSGDESGPDDDPKRPLSEKEIRNLIRAHEKFGSIEERGDEMVKEAKLSNRDREVVKATLKEVMDHCRDLLREEQVKNEAMARENNKVLTKKDKKAILFDWKGVKRLNAETILERPHEMRLIKEAVAAASEWRNFRLPEASKPAHYSCPWGAREDGMLAVGISKHGYGSWVAIRDDPELGMQDKFFLEEHRVDKKEERSKAEDKNAKSPGAVHLVRRANYLISVLKDKASNGTNAAAKRALDNHHRNNKKWTASRRPEKQGSASASPGPANMRKVNREQDRARNRTQSHSEHRHEHRHSEHRHGEHRHGEHRHSVDRRSEKPDRNGTPEVRRKASGELDDKHKLKHKHHRADERPRHSAESHHRRESSNLNGHANRSNPSAKLLKPVQENLDALVKCTSQKIPDRVERSLALKKEFLKVGQFISQGLRERASPTEKARLWDFIANNFWPSKGVEGSKLNDMYQKIKISEEKAKTAGGEHDKAKTAGEPEHKVKNEPGSQEKGQGASAEQEKAKPATNGEEAKAT
ncbi:Chromodomain helicase hrp3 [Lasiodiplodia hormozganensis]|uniref:Chromodomain helicase hrp3 n=1 Tax=Lasiodiplodia hormozganensis TaxID=869390 RepID=A0AA39YX31_9PEZI|nr:Chromodomain helicase hrp3 [Lasiodiplodia hormozganensis]